MRFRGSLAARVSLLATVAVGLAVAGVAVAAYLTVRQQLYSSLDHSLLDRAKVAAQSTTYTDVMHYQVPSWVTRTSDVRILILDSGTGAVYISSADGTQVVRPGSAEYAVARRQEPQSTRTVTGADGIYRVAAVPGREPGTALILAQQLGPTDEALDRLGVVLALFGLLGVVGAAFAGWGVARNGLRPVRRLTDAVEEIARTENLDPIPVEGNDEVARLAGAFNGMLAAVSAGRDRQRQLVADASHELRTPLTSLRTNLDLLIQADARGGLDESARSELMDDVRFQIEELTTLIGDLTELARDEPIPAQLGPVDLAEVAERALDRVRRRGTGLHFDVHLEPWRVTGEAASLERAVLNLLDNAVKWSPPEGTVSVRLADGVLHVVDQGPGIAAADLPHVFERFYRSTESRTMPGSGLGLSIVRRVAERHGGAVRAGNAAGGGAAFWLWLPPATACAAQKS